MKKSLQKLVTGSLAVSLALGLTLSGYAPVHAAENRAMKLPISFQGDDWDASWWETSQSTGYTFPEAEPIQFTKDYAISYQLYIPKPVLASDGSAVVTSVGLDLMSVETNEYFAYVPSQISIQLLKDGTAYVPTYWDEENKKDVDASQYASVKASGDYLILTVKDLPIDKSKAENDGKKVELDVSQKAYFNISVNVGGVKNKINSAVYIDNLKLSADKTEIFSEDYTIVTESEEVYYLQNGGEAQLAAVEAFSNKLLTVAKSSVSVKKGKTVTIKATAAPTGKITYKSSNKKVATVTSKGVVKGVKAGKATITVTANGVSKKVTVTVKK